MFRECPIFLLVSLNEGTHLDASGALLAHEMGHMLGANHDGQIGINRKNPKTYNKLIPCPMNRHIMTPTQRGVISEWSSCSR